MPYENNDIIKNKASIELDVCGRKRTIESNEVEAKKIKIEVIKEQNCYFVCDDDKIEYTVKICNKSDANFYDVVFIDGFSDATAYVPNSFAVNGMKVTPMVLGKTLRYTIPELKEYEELTIKFEVDVI